MSEVRDDGNTPGAVSYTAPFARPRVRPEKVLRYELSVVATDVADMVSGIGGWLFDRAMAGWQVSVAADRECGDEHALRILGLKAVDLSGLWRSAGADAVSMTAIGTDRFESDDDRLTALRNPGGDVVFFGSRGPGGLGGQVHRVQYRPSAAALAFKVHALAVAGADPGAVGAVETMYRYGRSAGLLDADLMPVC